MASDSRNLKTLRRDARAFVKQIQKLRRKHEKRIKQEALQEIDKAILFVEDTISGENVDSIKKSLDELNKVSEKHLGHLRKSTMREYVESIGLAVTFALILRAFVVEAFVIPSASMRPTLVEGDKIFVNKGAYGVRMPFTTMSLLSYAEPERGDVVVFVFPREEAAQHTRNLPAHRRGCVDPMSLRESKDYIKRVIGLEGDKIKMINNQVYVNGKAIKTEKVVDAKPVRVNHMIRSQQREEHGSHKYTSQHFGTDANFHIDDEVEVQPGHVFVMGDNRDNSSDSRCWGQVPVNNIKGKAMFIWWSSNRNGTQWDRIGKSVDWTPPTK